MRSAKSFLIAYAAVYFVGAIGLNVWLGPPGMSRDYLDQYKADHDRYVEIQKRSEFKMWKQRPHLNPPDERLALAIAFAEEYEARPEFQSEMVRRTRYDLLFDLFNTAMLILLIVRFGWKPTLGILDRFIEALRERIDRAAERRQDAEARRKAAQEQALRLEAEQTAIEERVEARIADMRREAALHGAQSLSSLNHETEDRKHNEEARARSELKRALVDELLRDVELRFHESDSATLHATLLDRFLDDIDSRKVQGL